MWTLAPRTSVASPFRMGTDAMDKKFALLAQVFMTFFMAALMSGILGLIFSGGFSLAWLANWPKQFIIAWPIAFLLTMVCWPLAMKCAVGVLRAGNGNHEGDAA